MVTMVTMHGALASIGTMGGGSHDSVYNDFSKIHAVFLRGSNGSNIIINNFYFSDSERVSRAKAASQTTVHHSPHLPQPSYF